MREGVSPRSPPRVWPEGSRGERFSPGHEEILRTLTHFDNVIVYLQVLRGSVALLVKN